MLLEGDSLAKVLEDGTFGTAKDFARLTGAFSWTVRLATVIRSRTPLLELVNS